MGVGCQLYKKSWAAQAARALGYSLNDDHIDKDDDDDEDDIRTRANRRSLRNNGAGQRIFLLQKRRGKKW